MQLKYQKFLASQRKELEQLVRDFLYPALPDLLQQAEFDRGGIRKDSARDILAVLFEDIALIFRQRFSDSRITNEVRTIADEVNEFSKQQHQRQMKAAFGIPVIQPEAFMQTLVSDFVKDNVQLVTTLQNEQLESLEMIVSSGLRKGLKHTDIQKEIQQKLGVTKSRAAFLARDQVGKFFGEMAQHRQMNAGVKQYRWVTSRDERVRSSHAALDKMIFSWDDPPIVDPKSGRKAHPGQDFRCRCTATPVIPEELLS